MRRLNLGRAWWWPVLLLPLTGCDSHVTAQQQPLPATSTRPAGFRNCPVAEVVPLPAGFRLVRRDLTSLGQQRMGKLTIYRKGVRQIQVFSGPDVYDKLDDVDLVPRQVKVGGRDFEMWTTKVDPTLLVAQLEDERLRKPCDNIGVLTRHLPTSTFMELLADLHVELPSQ